MPVEIERKFLVASDEWRAAVTGRVRLTDGLIASSGGRKVRVRIADAQASLTVKGARQAGARDEFEYPIPLEDAQTLLARHCAGVIVEKTRFFVPHAGLIWEVDQYHGLLDGVLIAEVELPAMDHPIQPPDWLGPEVTGQEAYRKINMLKARAPHLTGN